MVRVHAETSDKITAWRVRDRLAVHPLLGGAAVQIEVRADHESVVLTGWAADARLLQLVEQLSRRAAGRRSLSMQLHRGCLNHGCLNQGTAGATGRVDAHADVANISLASRT